MRSGSSSSGWFPNRSPEGDRPSTRGVTWWTRFGTSCGRDAHGVCCRTTFRGGIRSSSTSPTGRRRVSGSGSTTSSAAMCAKPRVEIDFRAQASSIASRSRPRKGGPRGYDAGKKICGRKRHLLVDTLGLVLEVVVHPANVQDRDGAKLLLKGLSRRWLGLRHLWADGGYAGQLVDWVRRLRGSFRPIALEIVKRSDVTGRPRAS